MTQKNLPKAIKDVTRQPRKMNEKIWDAKEKLRPEVRKKLLKIAKSVWEDIEHDAVELHDIIFTGSLAGTRWTSDSDVDLHLVLQFKDVDQNEKLVDEYFRARTRLWNNQHDINIAGHPVEIYVQDVDAEHQSIRIYSIMNDEWLIKKSEGDYASFEDVSKKARVLAKDIRNAIKNLKEPTQQQYDTASSIMDRLRKMRSAGLKRSGEGSTENLAYKALRRAGLFEKLSQALVDSFDKMYSEN